MQKVDLRFDTCDQETGERKTLPCIGLANENTDNHVDYDGMLIFKWTRILNKAGRR